MSTKYKKIIQTRLLFVAASLIIALTALVVPFSVAEEANIETQPLLARADVDRLNKTALLAVPYDKDAALKSNSSRITVVGNQRDSGGLTFSQMTMNILEYKAKPIGLEDILPSISTISYDDQKILGVVLPPFVYLGKKF